MNPKTPKSEPSCPCCREPQPISPERTYAYEHYRICEPTNGAESCCCRWDQSKYVPAITPVTEPAAAGEAGPVAWMYDDAHHETSAADQVSAYEPEKSYYIYNIRPLYFRPVAAPTFVTGEPAPKAAAFLMWNEAGYQKVSLSGPDGWECRECHAEALYKKSSLPAVWPNHCDATIPEALRYLADHPRPAGGQQRFNSEHLLQLADEIEQAAKSHSPVPQPLPAGGVDADDMQRLDWMLSAQAYVVWDQEGEQCRAFNCVPRSEEGNDGPLTDWCNSGRAAIDAARGKIARSRLSRGEGRDVKDAARYRWIQLRTRGGYGEGAYTGQRFILPEVPVKSDIMRGGVAGHLDDAIDTALASDAAQGKSE